MGGIRKQELSGDVFSGQGNAAKTHGLSLGGIS
jgi:hypothetical protein